MVHAAKQTLLHAKLYKIFTSWLRLTMEVGDESNERVLDTMSSPPRWHQRGSPLTEQRSSGIRVGSATAKATANTPADIDGRRHGRTSSATSLDTSVDSATFGSPQSMGALSPVERERGASPLSRERGSLSPVQLLRRYELDMRSTAAARRTPSP